MARRRAGERFVKDAPYDVRDKDAEIRAATSYVPRKSSRNGAVIFNIATFIATCAAVLGIAFAATGGVGIEAIVAMLLAALLVLSSTHIALSWEKVVVLRFGKLNRVVGPGLYFTIPVIEHGTIRVDQRTIATPFYAEKTLTADLVPVTAAGRLVGFCTMLLSIGVVAIPAGIFSAGFVSEFRAQDARDRLDADALQGGFDERAAEGGPAEGGEADRDA
ncbi:MAG: SPFH domain-containing protein [Eggerthella sp.]|nr:SPFH domain-containing protein [Eggerthella sp.]